MRDNIISGWHDRMITAGDEWKGEIDVHLDSAKIVLLLVSADFIHSDYCYDEEMKRALQRHEAGETRVIPIILRPCDWHTTPFGKLQALPRDGKPISLWNTSDQAYYDIALGIRRAVQEISKADPRTQKPDKSPGDSGPPFQGGASTSTSTEQGGIQEKTAREEDKPSDSSGQRILDATDEHPDGLLDTPASDDSSRPFLDEMSCSDSPPPRIPTHIQTPPLPIRPSWRDRIAGGIRKSRLSLSLIVAASLLCGASYFMLSTAKKVSYKDLPPCDTAAETYKEGVTIETFDGYGDLSIEEDYQFTSGVILSKVGGITGGSFGVNIVDCTNGGGFFGVGCEDIYTNFPSGHASIGKANWGLVVFTLPKNASWVEARIAETVFTGTAMIARGYNEAGALVSERTLCGADKNTWRQNRLSVEGTGIRRVEFFSFGNSSFLLDNLAWKP